MSLEGADQRRDADEGVVSGASVFGLKGCRVLGFRGLGFGVFGLQGFRV